MKLLRSGLFCFAMVAAYVVAVAVGGLPEGQQVEHLLKPVEPVQMADDGPSLPPAPWEQVK
jgi:hypothetical protein